MVLVDNVKYPDSNMWCIWPTPAKFESGFLVTLEVSQGHRECICTNVSSPKSKIRLVFSLLVRKVVFQDFSLKHDCATEGTWPLSQSQAVSVSGRISQQVCMGG